MTRRGRARHALSMFSLSFLDVMSCGLGAVVLLFMVIKHDAAQAQPAPVRDDLERVLLARDIALDQSRRDRAVAVIDNIKLRQAVLDAELQRLQRPGARADDSAEIAKLQAALQELRQRQVEYEQAALQVVGAGRRQYLSGSSITGKRIAILLDASASMLAPTVIDALRWRAMPAERQRQSPKWRRAQKTARWLMANLPAGAEFHLSAFNAEVVALTPTEGWHAVKDRKALDSTTSALDALLPAGGSSLENGIEAMRELRPPPDSLYLITDGLPTQGKKPPKRKLVTGKQRLKLFRRAIDRRPPGVPVHTMLLGMEGDPMAAPHYWLLATSSRGSFISPTGDWP